MELSELATSIPTLSGGVSHDHIGMITDDTVYKDFSKGGAAFITPTNPGSYPCTLDPNVVICERQVVEH
jgi:hypothetical protein